MNSNKHAESDLLNIMTFGVFKIAGIFHIKGFYPHVMQLKSFFLLIFTVYNTGNNLGQSLCDIKRAIKCFIRVI